MVLEGIVAGEVVVEMVDWAVNMAISLFLVVLRRFLHCCLALLYSMLEYGFCIAFLCRSSFISTEFYDDLDAYIFFSDPSSVQFYCNLFFFS